MKTLDEVAQEVEKLNPVRRCTAKSCQKMSWEQYMSSHCPPDTAEGCDKCDDESEKGGKAAFDNCVAACWENWLNTQGIAT